MGGTIELDSERGRGTRVQVRLPLPPLAEPPAATGTVLICDDDDTSRVLLSGLLRHAGYRVDEVDTARDALARWRAGGIGALITDLHMPGLGGAELIRRLRAEEAGRATRTPAIVCSGSAVADEIPDGLDIDARLVKPVDAALVVLTLQRLGLRAAAAHDTAGPLA
jgi:CheY-like chemotaxis protein